MAGEDEQTRPGGHWNDAETVERFGGRDADLRLKALVEDYDEPARVRVLDLGCAGGRNAELLAARGFDLVAIDLAPAMVEATRVGVARQLGEAEAERRVRIGTMHDLSRFEDGAFDLVVALGVLHLVTTEEDWFHCLAEAVRVLAPGGLLLVSNFAPGTGPVGESQIPIRGSTFLYEGFRVETMALRRADESDADFAALGLEVAVPTAVVDKVVEDRRRVTVNALYHKPARRGAQA